MTEKFRNTFLAQSLLFILAGLALIIWPYDAETVICIIAGCVLILMGLVQIFRCWKGDSLGKLDGAAVKGVLMLLAGMFLLIKHSDVIYLFTALVGVFLITDGFIKLQIACALKRDSIPGWKRDIIISLVMMAVGVFMLFDPFAYEYSMVIATGVILVLNGIINGWMAFEANKKLKK